MTLEQQVIGKELALFASDQYFHWTIYSGRFVASRRLAYLSHSIWVHLTAKKAPGKSIVKINDLEDKALWLRRALWNMVMRQRKGHIPSSYSCAEIMVALYYGGVARVVSGQPDEPNRDRIIVSKGHAAMVQYPIYR